MTADVLSFTVAFGVLASFVVAGFALLFTEVLAQTNALAAAITAARS